MPGGCANLRPGLSRVEVAVFLAIFLLLTGLFLSAMARVREAETRINCRNNLKHIALSFQSYHDACGHLPMLTDLGKGAPTGTGLPSALAEITPYISARPILFRPMQTPPVNYHAHSSVPFIYTHKDNSIGTQYGGVANQSEPWFVDPSDLTAERLRDVQMTLPDGTTGYYATGSYALNGQLNWGSRAESLFRSSYTILIAEKPQVCRTGSGDVVYNLWGLGFYSPHMPYFGTLTPTDPPGLLSTGQVAPVRPLPDENLADRDAQIQVRIGRMDAEPQIPDFAHPIQLIDKNQTCDPRLPGSPHRMGMQAGMADGSVRVFSFDTEPWVFWTACQPP